MPSRDIMYKNRNSKIVKLPILFADIMIFLNKSCNLVQLLASFKTRKSLKALIALRPEPI
jgi:hypothetical protein